MADYADYAPDSDFLTNLRNDYSEDETGWRPVRENGRMNMRYIAGDAWEPADRSEREKNKRLCLTFDEFSQYSNQLINDSLQNKRAIKVTANGNGANDKEAELRANRIRQTEYRSNAQQAYTTAFENTVQRSYGWVRIINKFVNSSRTEQETIIQAVPNPDMVTPGPHVMPDGSDIQRLWFHEQWSHAEFKRKFPKAKLQDFSSREWSDLAPAWIQRDKIMVCEYWTKDEEGRVVQRITNGVEVLGTTEWAGKDIPFVPCYGKIVFFADGGRTERRIQGLIDLAREPFKGYCYVRTCQAEIVAQMPKFPYMVRKGSLDRDNLEALERSTFEPVALIEVEVMIPEMSAAGPPEFPVRNPYDPTALAALDQTAEAFRRAIQAAIGQSALPTQAQRRNEKSGVALKQIEDSGQRGSFHFLAHYEAMITRVGLLLNDLLKPIHDTARDMTIRKPDDSTKVVRINDPNWQNPDSGEVEHLQFTDGDFDVTISTGPQNDSEREAQSDFADLMISSPEFAQIAGPQNMPKIMAKAIRLKNVGPLGDAIADLLDPPQKEGENDPQQMQAQMAQAQQNMDLLSKQVQGLTETIKTDQVKIQGQLELQDKKAKLEIYLQEQKDATSIRIAEINASVKGYAVEAQHAADHEQQALGHAVEMSEAENARQHEAALAAMHGDQSLEQGDQQHAQALEQGDQAHQQQLEQGAMGHEQALEQGAQQAALAPQPEA